MSSVRIMSVCAVALLCSLAAGSGVARPSAGNAHEAVLARFEPLAHAEIQPLRMDTSRAPGKLIHCRMYFGCAPVPLHLFDDTED